MGLENVNEWIIIYELKVISRARDHFSTVWREAARLRLGLEFYGWDLRRKEVGIKLKRDYLGGSRPMVGDEQGRAAASHWVGSGQ